MTSPPTQTGAPDPRFTRRRALASLIATPFALSATKLFSAPSNKATADSVDVIVVGAGAIGCNTAWHLHERGQRVVLLEARESAATQSTAGAAGFVAHWSGVHSASWKKTHWEMQDYGINFYTALAKRTPGDIGFSACGITYIYGTPAAWKKLQPRIKEARGYGTKLEVLTKERAQEVAPFLEFDQLAGIAFDPASIRVRAGDAIAALAKELAAAGVDVRYNTRVSSFLREGDRVVGVATPAGELRAKNVIVAAGAWTRPLVEHLGLTCPARPFNETRYVTKPIAGIRPDMPLLIFADHNGHYIREEKGGLLIGGGDDHPLPADRTVDPESPPWCSELPSDQAHRVQKLVKEVFPLMPLLEKAEVSAIRSGIPSTTADRNFIAGPAPGLAGLFFMTGCQEAGVTHGPALGKILTEYALDGKTKWDTSIFSPARFKA